MAGLDGLREAPMAVRPGRLWPTPHEGRFDFDATAAGAEWIDAVAAEARSVLDGVDAGAPVVGHADWRADNMRFTGSEVSAVYDRDSLRVMPEPVLVGSVAHMPTAGWYVPGRRQLPALAEALAFASDDEAARGRALAGAAVATRGKRQGLPATPAADLLDAGGEAVAPIAPAPPRRG